MSQLWKALEVLIKKYLSIYGMETWKIIRYAPNYQVSNLGNIKSKTNRLLLINYERLKKSNTRARPGLSVNGELFQYYLINLLFVRDHFFYIVF